MEKEGRKGTRPKVSAEGKAVEIEKELQDSDSLRPSEKIKRKGKKDKNSGNEGRPTVGTKIRLPGRIAHRSPRLCSDSSGGGM